MAESTEMRTLPTAHFRNGPNEPRTLTEDQPEILHVRVVFCKGNGSAIAKLLPVAPAASGEDVMRALHQLYRIHQGRWQIFPRVWKALCMQRLTLTVAVITPADAEAMTFPRLVVIESREDNALLTDAFHNPSHFRSIRGFARKHLHSTINDLALEESRDNKALLVDPVFSKQLAYVWLATSLVASIFTGVMTGWLERSVYQGVLVGTGLLANLATVQGVLVWIST
ncbi:hypothetical protein MBLNU459_g4423t1 [Dothideomycetes sp. NU459]